MTHVVVCIVGFRNPADIEQCLASLAQSTYPVFEVVICENGGERSRSELASRIGPALPGGQPITLLPQSDNLGYAGGNNRCIFARPNAAVWWILNPDTRVAPDAMALLADRLASGSCDAVSGALIGEDGTVQAYAGRWRPLLARAVSIGHGTAYDPHSPLARLEPDYLVGASLMFTSRFLESAGPMREDYFLYGEEVEWCLRAKARGLRLGIEPRAVIHHGQGTTTGNAGGFARRPRLPIYLDQRNKLLILADTNAPARWLCALGSLSALVARAGKGRAWKQLGYGAAGWWAGLRGERGAPPWMPSS